MRILRMREAALLQLPGWVPGVAVGVSMLFGVGYLIGTQEGQDAARRFERPGLKSGKTARELTVPTPLTGRLSKLYWLAQDGLWSVQEQRASESLEDRIEQLSNLILDRLGMDLLVIQCIVAEDDVAYLFFSVGVWEPSAQTEVCLVQSLSRTLLTDLPWLRGLRLVLPSRHLDYSRPLQRFDPGFDPLIRKSRTTLGLEVPP